MSGQHEAKEDVAALGFMAFLALCLGGAGVLVAALAVGVERAWSGRQGGSDGDGWGQSVADHRAWLDHDRAQRAAWRQARRQWWRDGADPAKRPAQPSWAVRAGSAARRWWARLIVSADRTYRAGGRFGAGFRAGWVAAQQARRAGAPAGQVARTRPGDEQPQGVVPPESTGDQPEVTPPVKWDPEPEPEAAPTPPPWAAGEEDPTGTPQPEPTTDTTTAKNAGGTMPTSTATPAAGAPTGETNLDLVVADLAAIRGHLARIQDLNDQMGGARAALDGAVTAASERANAAGATAATRQALDEAGAVAAQLGRHVSNVSDASAAASDHVAAAEAGLKPAQDAQDTLHTAGATGEFVSAATAD